MAPTPKKDGIDIEALLGDDDGDEEIDTQADDEGEDGGEESDAEASEGEESDAEASEGEEEVEPQVERNTRRSDTIRGLRRRAQEAEAKAAKAEELERRLNQLEHSRQDSTRQESREEEEARLALMTPEEKMDYKLDKATKLFETNTRKMQFEANDVADRANFQALAVSDKLARKFAPEVERRLADLKSRGQYANREVILNYLVGEVARKAASSGKVRKQRVEGQRSVNRERLNTGSSRSDVSSNRGRKEKTLEERLEGVKI